MFSGFLTAFGACEHSLALPLPHTWQLCQGSKRILSRSRQPCWTDIVQGFVIWTEWELEQRQALRSQCSAKPIVGAGAAAVIQAAVGLGRGKVAPLEISAFHPAGTARSMARLCWTRCWAEQVGSALSFSLPFRARSGPQSWQSPWLSPGRVSPKARQPGTLQTAPGKFGREL